MSNEVIVAFITGILGPVIVLLVKKFFTKKDDKCVVEEAIKSSELVVKKLEDIKEHYKCDRVWICQFHNGGNFYPTGKSITKFSMIYEVVGVNANSVQSQFQNIPVNLFTRSLKELLEKNVIEIFDFKDETIPTFGLKYVAEESGCKSGYLFAIKTIDGRYIATMGLDYTKKRVKLDDLEVAQIKTEAALMGGSLLGKI